jgi:Cys-rich protein (TIGR01571 family)
MAQGQPYGTEKVVMISTVAQGAPIVGPPQWTQTLCGCADNCSIFCEEFWCAYCHLGYLYDTIETGGRDMDPLVCCGALCIDYFIGGLARCIVIMHLRDRIIHRYGIQEGGVKTCCISCWCSSCAMCQMHRELEGRHEYTGGCCYTAPVPAGAPMGAMAGSEQKPQTGQPGQPQPYQYPQDPYAQQQQQQQQHAQPYPQPAPHPYQPSQPYVQQHPYLQPYPQPQQQQQYQPQHVQQGYAPPPPQQQIHQQPHQDLPTPLGQPSGRQYSQKTV